jgi:hypothetical protein
MLLLLLLLVCLLLQCNFAAETPENKHDC